MVRLSKLRILPSSLCSSFNCALVISTDHSLSQFSSNLPPPPRSRSSGGFGTASGGQPWALSSDLVSTSITVVTSFPDGADSLSLIPSHGHRVHEDVVPPTESVEPALGWTRENNPRMRALSTKDSDL